MITSSGTPYMYAEYPRPPTAGQASENARLERVKAAKKHASYKTEVHFKIILLK